MAASFFISIVSYEVKSTRYELFLAILILLC